MSEQKLCPTCGTEYPLSERFCPRDGTALRSTNALGDMVGSVVADRYHIIKKLGEGGMGTVYLAEHVKMGRKSALKVMNPGMNQDPDAIARFNREAANASRLSHPNICAIYDFGETPEGLIYLAMEFIEGQSLTDVIETNHGMSAPRAASIIHQAADALGVAHDAGIVHRDLKPDNIMIMKGRDGSDMVKVVDFGIAKASSSDAQKVTKTGLVVGTPEYMSPEQLAGDKLDGRSDIYSLALVAFNCLTGTLPFPSNSAQEAMIMRLTDHPKTLAEMRPDVEWPAELQAVMDKALARDADERYQKAPAFGIDMVKSVQNMPATVAAAAGTLVIGAAGNVPATRVASPGSGGATKKLDAVSAAPSAVRTPTKSKTPMLIGAVAVLALGGAGAFFAMKPKGVEKPVTSADSTALKTSGTTQQATRKTQLGAEAATNGGTAVNSKLSNGTLPLNPGPGRSGGAPAPTGAVPSAVNFDAEMTKIRSIGSSDLPSAQRTLSAINELLPKLKTRDDSVGALFEKVLPLTTIDGDAVRACKQLQSIKDERSSHHSGIVNAYSEMNCK